MTGSIKPRVIVKGQPTRQQLFAERRIVRYRILRPGVFEKCCQRCERWLEATNEHFHVTAKGNRRTPDGLHQWCKACYNDYRREWKERKEALRMREKRGDNPRDAMPGVAAV